MPGSKKNSEFATVMRTRVVSVSICLVLAGLLAAIIIFPDLFSRWVIYNKNMIERVTGRIFPYFWVHIALAASVVSLEVLVVGWRRSSLRAFLHPDKTLLSDFGIFFFRILQLDTILLFILTLGFVNKLKLGIKTAVGLDEGFLAAAIPNLFLQILVYVIILDFIYYVQHLLHHKLSFLWPFHSYHHSATAMNVITANRNHPIEAEFSYALIAVIPLTLMGTPLDFLLAIGVVRNVLTHIHHSRLPWDWGWFGKYVLVSPGYHRIHHSVLPEHFNKNLAVLFPVWDHLFGTHYKGLRAPGSLGLPDSLYHRKNFFYDMLVPFRMLFKR